MEKNSLFNNYSFSDLFWDEMITKKLEVRDHYKLLKKVFLIFQLKILMKCKIYQISYLLIKE